MHGLALYRAISTVVWAAAADSLRASASGELPPRCSGVELGTIAGDVVHAAAGSGAWGPVRHGHGIVGLELLEAQRIDSLG